MRGLPRAAVWVLALGWVAGAGGAGAAPPWGSGSQPLQVDARTLDARGAENRVIFAGEVVARQGDLTLQADRVEVTLDPGTRELRTVHATGNVRVQKEEVVAVGREATYEAATGVVVLTGEPKVWRDRDVVAGDKVVLYLAENRSVVEGARAVIFPGKPPPRALP